MGRKCCHARPNMPRYPLSSPPASQRTHTHPRHVDTQRDSPPATDVRLLLVMQQLVLHRAAGAYTATPRSLRRFLGEKQQQQQQSHHLQLTRASSAMPAQAAGKWKSHGSQQDFMLQDNCIVVDERDVITGSANKADAHRFGADQPQGLLHRAFSVFLFSSDGKLLLQQRAQDKITFPGVWTNTCCSHPLYGQEPAEIDSDEDIASGAVPGARAAAVRKLQHELGISPQQLPPSALKFLTRLHYCAPDSGTYGEGAPWGEHEIDYILVAQADVNVTPNPEEVAAVKHVDLQELQAMMEPGSGLQWSPWFRIIARHFLPAWWADLQRTLSTQQHVDAATIHRLEC